MKMAKLLLELCAVAKVCNVALSIFGEDVYFMDYLADLYEWLSTVSTIFGMSPFEGKAQLAQNVPNPN